MLRLLPLLALATACSGGDTAADDTGGTDTGEDSAPPVCGEPGETYTAGMSHPGDLGVLTFSLVDVDPEPPDKGENTWTVRTDLAGGGALGGAMVTITPFMPEHGHGSTPADFTATAGTDGVAVVGPMDLFMAGLWELTVSADDGAGTSDHATFTFCLEG